MSEKVRREPFEMRILLAFEKRHTTHMDAVRLAIRGYRPDAQVMAIEPGVLEEETERFDPHLSISKLTLDFHGSQ